MSDRAQMRLLDWIVGIATLVAVSLGSWSIYTTHDHESRLGVIEETRYTREDAANDRAVLLKEMETPPKWVTDRLDLILVEMRSLKSDVRELRESQ